LAKHPAAKHTTHAAKHAAPAVKYPAPVKAKGTAKA
jgi:hypothetical protein